MKHINELRQMLGEVIQGVRAGTLDVEQARAIKGLADSVIDTAKVEVDYCRITNADGTGFVSGPLDPTNTISTTIQHNRNGVREITQQAGVTRTVNRAR